MELVRGFSNKNGLNLRGGQLPEEARTEMVTRFSYKNAQSTFCSLAYGKTHGGVNSCFLKHCGTSIFDLFRIDLGVIKD